MTSYIQVFCTTGSMNLGNWLLGRLSSSIIYFGPSVESEPKNFFFLTHNYKKTIVTCEMIETDK